MPDASRKFGHRNRQRNNIRPDCKIIVMKRQRPRSLAFSFVLVLPNAGRLRTDIHLNPIA